MPGFQQNFSYLKSGKFTAPGQISFDVKTQVVTINTDTDAIPEISVKLPGVSSFDLSNVLFAKPELSSVVGTPNLSQSYGSYDYGQNGYSGQNGYGNYGYGYDQGYTGQNYTGLIEGNTLNNTLQGGPGDDVMYGYTGNDTLTDLQGNNKLFGGTDDDVLTTGAGNDWLDGDTGYDVLIAGEGNNWLDAGPGDDKLQAGSGNDTLNGGTGDDLIEAGAGDDLIDGGTGVDNIIGGMGKDLMKGGTGADIFTFNDLKESGLTAATRDVISDFVHSDGDKIDVRAIDADVNASGIQGFTYINTAGFSAAGQLRFDPSTNTLYASNDNDFAPEFSLTLTGITTFQLSDLLY